MAVTVALGASACSGGNGGGGGNGDPSPRDTESRDDDADTSAADSEMPPADGRDDTTDGNDGQPPASKCGVSVTNLGELSVGNNWMKNGALEGANDSKPSCAVEAESAGAAVYAFRVAEPAMFEARVSGRAGAPVDPAVQVFSGECGSDGDVAFCTSTSAAQAYLQPNRWYFAWVHGSTEPAEPHFTLRYGLQASSCTPEDHPTCMSGTRTRCPEGTQLQEYACNGECASGGSRCAGDTCQQATALDLSGGSVTVRADRLAYEGDWTAKDLSNCQVNDGGGSFDSDGTELFAQLQGISSGDTVVFDSVGTGGEDDPSAKGVPVAFLVLSGCNATQCTAAGLYNDSGNNRIEWQVDSAGPYYLVAEVLGNQLEDEKFEFDVIRQ